jgi:hypothetical protein
MTTTTYEQKRTPYFYIGALESIIHSPNNNLPEHQQQVLHDLVGYLMMKDYKHK